MSIELLIKTLYLLDLRSYFFSSHFQIKTSIIFYFFFGDEQYIKFHKSEKNILFLLTKLKLVLSDEVIVKLFQMRIIFIRSGKYLGLYYNSMKYNFYLGNHFRK